VNKDRRIVVSVYHCRTFDVKTFQSGKERDCKGEQKVGLKRVLKGTGRILRYLVIFAIRIYQNTLRLVFPPSCRFYPSCSEYAIEAFRKFGLIKGGWLSVKRLSRCHPFNPGGFDPLP